MGRDVPTCEACGEPDLPWIGCVCDEQDLAAPADPSRFHPPKDRHNTQDPDEYHDRCVDMEVLDG